jgi:hypothetical protein
MSNQIVPQQTLVLGECITYDYGCTIVSMDCSSVERYAFLPTHITRNGVLCARVSYHPDTKRVYYRSAQ